MIVKDLTLDMIEKRFHIEGIRSVLFIREDGNSDDIVSPLEAKLRQIFSYTTFYNCKIGDHVNGKYDLIVPGTSYVSVVKVRRKMERFGLKHLRKAFIIYEDTYHTIRLAQPRHLYYRLYIRPVMIGFYVIWTTTFVFIPCFLLSPFVKLLHLRNK